MRSENVWPSSRSRRCIGAAIDAEVLRDAGRSCTVPMPSSVTTRPRTCARRCRLRARRAARRAAAARNAPSRDRRSDWAARDRLRAQTMPLKSWPNSTRAAEHALMDRAVGRRIVREADAPRLPVGAEKVRSIRNTTPIASSVDWRTGPACRRSSSSRSTTTSPLSSMVRNSASLAAGRSDERLQREPQRRLLADEQARADRDSTAAASRPSAGRRPRRRCARPTPRAARARRRSAP